MLATLLESPDPSKFFFPRGVIRPALAVARSYLLAPAAGNNPKEQIGCHRLMVGTAYVRIVLYLAPY